MSSTRLGRVARTISGSGFPPSEQGATSGDFPFVKVSDLALKANAHRVVDAANWVTRQQATALGARIVPSDSIVFPKVGAALLGNARGRTDIPLLIDNNMMAVVPTYLDTGFSYWWLRSVDMAQLSEGGTLPFVSDTAVRDLRVPVMSIDRQQRVADFLDDRVARIDQIITARERQAELLTAHLRSAIATSLGQFPTVPMRYLAREILVGIVIQPSELYTNAEDGVPALRGLNVREGEVVNQDLVRITSEGHLQNPRSRLQAGDVVVVRTGDAGSAAVVPQSCHDWNCIDLVIVRPNPGASASFLELALNSARHQATVAAAASGAMQQHFGVNALAALAVPYPSSDADRVASKLAGHRQEAADRRAQLLQSIALLADYKQSLVTAAVTGELDVTTAGSGIPT